MTPGASIKVNKDGDVEEVRVAPRKLDTDKWIAAILPRYQSLTEAIVTIIESLLKANGIDYLAVIGRTKTADSTKDKIKRKSYRDPATQLTDISGVRVIVYFESAVQEVSRIIESAFCVDRPNSLDKQALLATDQTGYRSVHYVCDIGKERSMLPEFTGLGGLKFECQIRTVLQHAWAELAHDRNYKFSGKLPREMERKLYLYAGMIEIADKGFDELSHAIDLYVADTKNKTGQGDLNIEVNSISLEAFVRQWATTTGFPLEEETIKSSHEELVSELKQFGIIGLADLASTIPKDYVQKAARCAYATNVYGVVRDWMIIKDYLKYHDEVERDWSGLEETAIYYQYFDDEEVARLCRLFGG